MTEKKSQKDLLGTNEQIGRTLVSTLLAINSNEKEIQVSTLGK
jgi:hypothetical protein